MQAIEERERKWMRPVSRPFPDTPLEALKITTGNFIKKMW
jgi:hypothetical protein